MQETARAQGKVEFGAMRIVVLGDTNRVQRFQGRIGLAQGRPKGRKIMMPDQMRRPDLHRGMVQRVQDLPDQAFVMRYRRAALHEAEQIAAFHRGKPCVKIIRHLCRCHHRNRCRAQMRVDCTHQAICVPILGQIAMRHLPQAMHACIGAASGGYGLGRIKLCQRCL